MTFADFRAAVREAGLEPRRCSPITWQIRGGEKVVTIWPFTNRGFRFGARGEKIYSGSIQDAIKLAGRRDEEPPWSLDMPQRVGLIRWLWRWIW